MDSEKQEAIKKMSESFSENSFLIYSACLVIRDSFRDELNRGISNTKEREESKKHWRALNEFCNAYGEYLEVCKKCQR